MKRIKESLKNQGILFPTGYISDKLEDSDEVYQFDKLLDLLDLRGVLNSYSSEGGSLINPRDHLAVILYAYFQGIESSNKISNLTRTNVEFMYLSGGHYIKGRTIRTFRIRNKAAMKKLFESTVNLAIDVELVDPNTIFALDGSKFASNASFSTSRKKKDWEKRRENIISSVEYFFEQWEKQDAFDEENEKDQKEKFEIVKKNLEKLKNCNNKSVSEQVETVDNITDDESDVDEKQRKNQNKRLSVKNLEKAKKLLIEHESIEELLKNSKEIKNESYINIVEPDSHPMKSHGTIIEAYNIQAITNNQLIVVNEVTENENDQHDLIPMVNKLMVVIEELISKFPEKVPSLIKFLTDAGYNMGANLSFLDKLKIIDAYISMNDRSKSEDTPTSAFLKDNFQFDEEEEKWICPSGKDLNFIKEHVSDGKKKVLYGCTPELCLTCKNNKDCVTTKKDKKIGYRTIDDDMFTVFRNEMRTKMENEISKEIYAQRSPEIEGVFGQIKSNKGLKRFILRGIKKVKAEFNMIATIHNMGKIIKHLNRKPELWNACKS